MANESPVEEVTELLNPETAEKLLTAGKDLLIDYGPSVIAAIVIFFVGKWIAKLVRRVIEKMMTRSHIDPIIVGFTSSITYIALVAFVVVAALGQLGIQTTSFIAILGAAGLAIGLALQGSLSNFAAGFLLIIFRPFKVGDMIEAAGVVGIVQEIQIFTTTLLTVDNKTIIIPNAKLGGDNIINYSTEENRRVDLTVGVSYDADLKQVRNELETIVAAESRILKDPAHQIVVAELADNSVNFFVRVWVKTDDYWDVYFAINEQVKLRFDAVGIGIPYPQRDVHIYEHQAA
ncbi:MAG: mechanosensitive ion channel family protein [bacterium]